ncbi:MAG: CehA/McbA family metallohydrolase [Candidatus Lokiarchaeota archaeon]|nr:CehA/McbA family metallohydrolase [Candidatus Lokiarchaeota archaeon]
MAARKLEVRRVDGDAMNFWILALCIVGLLGYALASYVFCVFLNFKHHDGYRDEDVSYPRRRPVGVPADAFLVDLHAHTTASDGLLTPSQLVAWSMSNGYDGLVVSDHNTMDAVDAVRAAAARIDPSFVVIPGVEFTSLRAHMNLIGVRTPMKRPNLLWPSKRAIKEAIDHAHAQGGVVMFNHKAWYPYDILRSLPREWWLEQGIDGWEVYNGFGFVDEGALDFIKQHEPERTMFAGAGTDVHDPAKHHRMYTEILTGNRSVDGVITALKAGKTRAISLMGTEQDLDRPERGKIALGQARQDYIRKWFLLDWIGIALLEGKYRRAVKLFPLVVISLGIVLSLLA